MLSFPRSYSSVVTTMLGQHPELVGLPETKLFLYATLGELDASLPPRLRASGISHRSPGLVRAIAEFVFGDQSPQSAAAALTWLQARADWTGADALDVILARTAPRPTVEKSPENVVSDAALRRLSKAFPRARFLHLVRHPITTASSLEEHWRRTLPAQPVRHPVLTGLASWLDTNQRIARFAATMPEDRYLCVRAEDVLNDAERQLRTIAQWLGARHDETAVRAMCHPEASPFARFGPPGVTGGNDHGFLGDPVLRPAVLPAALSRPGQLPEAAKLWSGVVALAGQLGYAGGERCDIAGLAAAGASGKPTCT